MAINEIRQQARRSAAERVARLRQQRADLVRQQEELSSAVMTALAERDALVVDSERRAGKALTALLATGLRARASGGDVRPGRRPAGAACLASLGVRNRRR